MTGLKKTMALMAVTAVLASWPSEVQAAPGDGATNIKTQRFNRLDADKDGKLTPEEWQGSMTFAEIDADGDGVVNLREFLVDVGPAVIPPPIGSGQGADNSAVEGDLWTERLAGKQQTGDGEWSRMADTRSPRGVATTPLKTWDSDGDGRLTAEEWKGAVQFAELDTDGDGVLAGAELDAAAAAIAGQRQHRPAAEPAASEASALDQRLAAMDGDGDGRVSREEWNGEDVEWNRLDRNRDGFVTVGEAG